MQSRFSRQSPIKSHHVSGPTIARLAFAGGTSAFMPIRFLFSLVLNRETWATPLLLKSEKAPAIATANQGNGNSGAHRSLLSQIIALISYS